MTSAIDQERTFALSLGDSLLIHGHRISEWCGHAPILEEDIALSNISLDYIGQAKHLLEFVAKTSPSKCTADELAFFRNAEEFKSFTMVSLPNGDFAQTILKIHLFGLFLLRVFKSGLRFESKDIQGVCEKGSTEVNYHLKHSEKWIEVFTEGTEESRERLTHALKFLLPWTRELMDFEPLDINNRQAFETDIKKFLVLYRLDSFAFPDSAPKKTITHLQQILSVMQSVARAHPGASW